MVEEMVETLRVEPVKRVLDCPTYTPETARHKAKSDQKPAIANQALCAERELTIRKSVQPRHRQPGRISATSLRKSQRNSRRQRIGLLIALSRRQTLSKLGGTQTTSSGARFAIPSAGPTCCEHRQWRAAALYHT